MCRSSERLGNDVRRFDAADFLDRAADQLPVRASRAGSFLGAACVRTMAKASITSETCRCQQCQEQISSWSRPSSLLVVSKLSSITQRYPSTNTRSTDVPTERHVEKRATSPSGMSRWISGARVQRYRDPHEQTNISTNNVTKLRTTEQTDLCPHIFMIQLIIHLHISCPPKAV